MSSSTTAALSERGYNSPTHRTFARLRIDVADSLFWSN
jgi:hypothetical protein